MAERAKHLESDDQPEPEQALPETPPPREHERELSDADDRGVELDEPDSPDEPIDEDDRDAAGEERR
jgi:hypothetical protein